MHLRFFLTAMQSKTTLTQHNTTQHNTGGDAAKHGLRPGAALPKADIKGFTLDLKEDQPEPLASFARAVATGMGEWDMGQRLNNG